MEEQFATRNLQVTVSFHHEQITIFQLFTYEFLGDTTIVNTKIVETFLHTSVILLLTEECVSVAVLRVKTLIWFDLYSIIV